tara:strand:- start:102 stop:476 length:375 start_codon:yes stop_codon:yes gene_type:complete
MNRDGGIMRSVDTRSKEERLTDVECRQLYNKIIKKLNDVNFKTTPKDKQMLAQLRECELYLRELSAYSDLIYQNQVKEGNDIQEEADRALERDERNIRTQRDEDDRKCREATARGERCDNNELE